VTIVSQATAQEWRGTYTYPDGRQSVPFVLTLSGSQGAVTGRTTEPNTFGNRSATVALRLIGRDTEQP
jgi:hypothetical protein